MHLAKLALPASLLSGLLFTACVFVHAEDTSSKSKDGKKASATNAQARIEPKSGSSVTGTATFEQLSAGVTVVVKIKDAPPGWHAVHIHQIGDCSAPDGTSAGGHFNPEDKLHGSPHAPEHHLGDLGNLLVDADGNGYTEVHMPGLTVAAGPMSVVGRSIIVHADADDLVTQPTGAAGGRIACGVIR